MRPGGWGRGPGLPLEEWGGLERAMGFEPTTFCLGSKHSTTELRPRHNLMLYRRYLRVNWDCAPETWTVVDVCYTGQERIIPQG